MEDYPVPAVAYQAESGSDLSMKLGSMRRAVPMRVKIENEKKELLARVELLDKVLEVLNETPAIEKYQDLLAKLGHI